MIWFSATLGWYWHAYLSDPWATILSKNSMLRSPAATRALTTFLMCPWIVVRSVPLSRGPMMHTISASGYFERTVCKRPLYAVSQGAPGSPLLLLMSFVPRFTITAWACVRKSQAGVASLVNARVYTIGTVLVMSPP